MRLVRILGGVLVALVAGVALVVLPAAAASATVGTSATGVSTGSATGATTLVHGARMPDVPGPNGPDGPKGTGTGSDTSVTVDLGGLTDKPSTSVTVIIALTLLSLLPAILLTCTSFTKILVVLGLTRNALGLQQTPPNQVLAGLALFLSLFIMAPVLSGINDAGVQPYLHGTKTSAQAWDDGIKPLKGFMLEHTDKDELTLLTNDLAWITFTCGVPFLFAMFLFVALAIVWDDQPEPVFPRWVAWFNVAMAVAVAPAAFAGLVRGGPFAWDGVLSFWVKNAAFVAWIVVMALALRPTVERA